MTDFAVLRQKLNTVLEEIEEAVKRTHQEQRRAETPEWVADMINRKAAVEEQLWLLAIGKRGPIEKDEARALATKLGVPNPQFRKGL